MKNTLHADSGAPEMTEKSTDQFQFGTWYPIETAPRDKSIVILTDGDLVHPGCYVKYGKWCWHFFDTPFFMAELDGTPKTRMVTEANAWPDDPSNGPTHWMPLPPPPPAALETCGHEEAP